MNHSFYFLRSTFLCCALVSALGVFGQENDPSWEENFLDNQRNWPLLKSNKLESEIIDEQFHIRCKTGYVGNLFAIYQELPLRKSFSLEVSILHEAGEKNMAYGLVWGARTDEQDLFAFLLSANGKYTILRKERGQYDEIKRWTDSQLVRKSGKPNTLRIEREGHLIHYLLNGQRVYTSGYEKGRGNRIGILLHGNMRLLVDDLHFTVYAE